MNQTMLSVELGQSYRRDLEHRAAAYRAVREAGTARVALAPRSAARARRVRVRVTRWVRAVATA